MIITHQAGHQVMIQFRLGRLDLRPVQLAREAFAPKVPEIKLLQDQDLGSEGVWGYWMTSIQLFSSGFELTRTIKASL